MEVYCNGIEVSMGVVVRGMGVVVLRCVEVCGW